MFFQLQAFAMPLILVCSTYAYFKLVPLKYGIPILVGVFVVLQIQGQIKTLREKKIENMNETDINDLALELEDDEDDKKKEQEEGIKLQKKKARLAERLAAEQRKAEKAAKRNHGKKKKGNDDDGDDDMAVFAKGSRNQKKKN